MASIRKLKSVEINDFRAFKGEMPLDFTVDSGEAADLVVMYAPNGMGKTSFFDAIEWGFTGQIDRFENDIKAKNYEGYILKNRDSLAESTSVIMKFDDNAIVRRKTQRLNKKDYTKGKVFGDVEICAFQDWGSLILPHNKIDGLISATSPTEKYNYWGSYWDATKSERKVFDFLFKSKKQAENITKSIQIEIKENENELNKLRITSENLSVINQYIEQYNVISSEKLQKINDNLSYEFLERFTKDISSKQQSLQEKYNIAQNTFNQLVNLKKEYLEYEKCLIEKDNIERQKKRWLMILENTRIKAQKTQEYNKLINDINNNQENFKKIKSIYDQGQNWLNKYLEYQAACSWIAKAINTRDEFLSSLNSWTKQKTAIDSEIVGYNQKISSLNHIKTNLLETSDKISEINLQLKNKEIRKIKLERLEEKLISSIMNLESDLYEINQLYFVADDVVMPKIKITKIEIDGEIKNQFISNMETTINNIKDLEKNVLISRTRYEEAEKLSTELDLIVKKGRDYILNTKQKSCPLCNREYVSMDELISCTGINKSDNINKYLNDWNQFKINLNTENENLMLLIKKWNSYIDTIKEEKINLLNKCKRKIIKLNNLKTKLANQFGIRSTKLSALIEIFNRNGFDEQLYSREYIDMWVDNRRQFFQEQISVRKITLSECEEYIKKTNQDIANLESEYAKTKAIKESFETSDNNELVSNLNELKISFEWAKICEQYNLNQETLQKYYNITNKLKKMLENYNWISIDKEDYYQKQKKMCDDVIQAQNNNLQKYFIRFTSVFRHENITLRTITNKYKKTQRELNVIKTKTSALSGVTSQVALSDYANKIEELIEKGKKLKKRKSIYEIVLSETTSLFDKAKLRIENKVTGIFNEALTNDIFQRIEPHPFMKKLKYEVSFNDDEKPELNIYVVSDSEQDKYLPEWYFSSAQLNVVALSTFLGRALSLQRVPVSTIFIDDPIGHFDDINLIAFVDLLRTLVEFKRCQIIISTHDENMFNLIHRKIPPNYYKSKFIKFKSVGVIA